MVPTPTPRWRIGATSRAPSCTEGRKSGMPRAPRWPAISETRRGSWIPLRYSKNPSPSGMSHNPWCSSSVRPETMKVVCRTDSALDGDSPVAGGRQRPRAVHYVLQHRVEVEALVDT